MVDATRRKVEAAGLNNVETLHKDFIIEGSGLEAGAIDYVMLFNILHAEERMTLLHEAWRILQGEGRLAIIHWNYDPSTPRGPTWIFGPALNSAACGPSKRASRLASGLNRLAAIPLRLCLPASVRSVKHSITTIQISAAYRGIPGRPLVLPGFSKDRKIQEIL